ncbi:MAG: MFS transporter [Candidatus Cloacimonadaceae bacterium]|nr:MFS transporter [Candidatus Cloacimonadaceae bacterium]
MGKRAHYTTKPEDRISLKQKAAYSVGMFVNNLQAAALPAMVVILNLGLGMDVFLVGLIGSIPRIFDAISDPLVGFISDKHRGRWGRRRPFIFVGALLAGLIFAIMWQVPPGYVDILGKDPVMQHQTISTEMSNAVINDDGGINISYDEQNPDVSYVLYGPELLSTKSGEAFATDLEGFPQIEMNVKFPEYQSLQVLITEAASDEVSIPETYYVDLTKEASQDKKGNLYKFSIGDFKLLNPDAELGGNKTLDTQSIQSIAVNLKGIAGAGAVTISSLKLRKPEGFFKKYFIYFLIMSILFFLAYTIYATPFVAFGYEMTPDYHERTRLHAFANTVGQLAWLGVPWFYAIMSSTLFRDTVHGARTLAIAVGIAVAALGMIPAIFLRETQVLEPVERVAKGVWKNMAEFFSGIKTTFKCKPFVQICGATFLVFNGFQLGASFSLYVMIYYLFNGNNSGAGKLMGWYGMLTSIFTLFVIQFTGWIATRIGKRRTFLITISLSLLGYAMKWFGYNPDHPYWLLFATPLVAFGVGSLFTLMGAMISDVCDYDELTTHQRREGVFGAIYWWMVKIGMSLAGLLTGVLLKVSKFDLALGSGQEEQTLFLLRIFDVGIPVLTSALAIWIISRYSLTESRVYEIRAELETRHKKTGIIAETPVSET